MMDVYLNNAATSWPKSEGVYRAVDSFLRQYGASQGRGGFRRSREATNIIEDCRRKLALYIGPGLILETLMEGGTGSSSLSPFQPDDLPGRFEVGTHNGPGLAGLGAALDFILTTGVNEIRAREHRLTGLIIEQLLRIPGVVVYGPRDPDQQVGVVSFNILDVNPEEVGSVLDEVYNIMVRTGLHCAPQAHRAIGTIKRGTVRVSPSFFNTEDEITYFLQVVSEIARQAVSARPEKSEKGDYLTGYQIQQTSPCYSDSSRVRVVASLYRDISELFPYLNAVSRGDFNQEGTTFTFSYGRHPIVLQAQQVIVGKTEDIETAGKILTAVLGILNKVAASWESIIPTTKPQIQLNPFAIYQHLPRTNCRECGEITCLAFAVCPSFAERR